MVCVITTRSIDSCTFINSFNKKVSDANNSYVGIVLLGAIGAEWLKAFKGYIENPETMLL